MPAEQSARGVSLERWSPDGWALRPTTLRAYVVAVLLVAGSLLVVWMFRAWFGGNVPYLQFFPAILIAAWYGGLGPGTLATVLSALAAMYFFLPPPGLAVGGVPDVMSLGFFVATGLGISWLKHQLRAAAVLSASRAERLDGIINTTVDGIIVIDAVGRIEAFNRGAERLFGYPQSEVLGRNVSMLMPFPYHEEHTSYLTRFLATGDAGIIGKGREVTGRRRDGTVFPLHLSVGEMTVGGQRKFTGMLHDLTERVRLEGQLGSSEARWRAIIDSAVDGIIVIDAHGRVETFNPAAERLFGYSAEEVLGRNVDMLMPSPYR
jgi:PAS domain S-box-containing protein